MSKRIVVVDDDQEIREIITFALTFNGFEVIAVENGQQLSALLVDGARLADLIILDVMMPDEDGYHIFRRLRTDTTTRHIPIIMMTAHAEGIYARISNDLGAAEHITKPFHPLEVVEKVKLLLI